MTAQLSDPVTQLNGVGPERSALLAKLDIVTIGDLLLHAPRRYEDRRHCVPIAQLVAGQPALVQGRIVALGTKYYRFRTKSIFEMIVDDGTARLHCHWWNAPYLEKHFARDDQVVLFGKVLRLKPRTIDHPEVEIIDAGTENQVHLHRIVPIYPLTESLSQRWLRGLIWRTWQFFKGRIQEPFPGLLPPSDKSLLLCLHRNFGDKMFTRAMALSCLHFPESLEDTEAARRRLAFDEFLELQLRMRERRSNFELKARALPCRGDNRYVKPFLRGLGFTLTESQTAVLREIRADMSHQHPMRRLLQGDVGSGKTVVAASTALMALESGYNVALMAPTEILAQQHYATFRRWFEPLGIRVELHTGGRKTIDERQSGNLINGSAPPATKQNTSGEHIPVAFIGTHALISEGFEPDRLGLVIIDEQHKFGVTQREKLVRKGAYPHLLVMTATPIPRTLGLTLYGDLDLSVIHGVPPGRGTIKTFVRTSDRLPKVWEFVRAQLASGRQVYVVYPRVEDSAGATTKAVLKEAESVQTALSPYRVGVLHGSVSARDKEQIMTAFREGSIQVLVASSIIEVGLDVPNATVMVIDGADQFGLAQLHQLRGRIGRGPHHSFCILLATSKKQEAMRRLHVLEQTCDGFQIAEADLRLRGPGELLGQQQSGLPRFRFGDLAEHGALIELARQISRGQGANP